MSHIRSIILTLGALLAWAPLTAAVDLPPWVDGPPAVLALVVPYTRSDGRVLVNSTVLVDTNEDGDKIGNGNFGAGGGFLSQANGLLTRLACPGSTHDQTQATALNRSPEVAMQCVINSRTQSFTYRATRSRPYRQIIIPGAEQVFVFGIEDHACTTGAYTTSASPFERGFVACPGQPVETFVVPFAGAVATLGHAINIDNVRIGVWVDTAGDYHGFYSEGGVWYTSFDVPGARWTFPLDLTDSEEIIGWYRGLDDTVGNFLLADVGYTEVSIPHLLWEGENVQGINNFRQVSGSVLRQDPRAPEEVIVLGVVATPLPASTPSAASSTAWSLPARMMADGTNVVTMTTASPSRRTIDWTNVQPRKGQVLGVVLPQ